MQGSLEKYEQIYFLDDGQETSDLILGTCLEYMKFADGNTEMYPAFGNNEMRLNWMKKLSDAQIVLPRLIHATAYVSPTAEVEAGTVVLPLAIINTDCRIQSGCIINCGSIVDHGCVIEEGVHISPGDFDQGRKIGFQEQQKLRRAKWFHCEHTRCEGE